jgi:GWxTD domain-containing protein
VLCLLPARQAGAQTERQRPAPRAQRLSTISFEAIPFFSTDTTGGIVNIHYRIREDFFIVLRNIESIRPDDFLARGEILIELLNNDDVSVARHLRTLRLRKTRIPQEQDSTADVQGSVSFAVPPGTYTVFLNVEDRQSERSFTNRTQKVTTRSPLIGFDVSAPVFVEHPKSPADRSFTALNRGTDVYFGERGGHLYAVHFPSSSSGVLATYTLTLEPEQSALGVQEFRGDSLLAIPGLAVLTASVDDTLSASSGDVRYAITNPSNGWTTVFLPLPLERLMPGMARLSVTFRADGVERTLDHTFRVLWLNQPAALRNMDLAIDALYHIASEEEMGTFRTFSQSRSIQRFFEFWRKKDPDTTTAYNELMVEYYRRVDNSIRQYSLGNETNGYKTDRGRIYILYGSPTDTRRLLTPNRFPREVWTYVSLKRRFIFEDQRRNGDYRLITVENL